MPQLVLDFSELRGKQWSYALNILVPEVFEIGEWCSTNNIEADIALGQNMCEFIVTFPSVADAVHFKLRWSDRLKPAHGEEPSPPRRNPLKLHLLKVVKLVEKLLS